MASSPLDCSRPGRRLSWLASMLIPGRRSQGLVPTCVIGIAGTLAGSPATRLLPGHRAIRAAPGTDWSAHR
jgi:uncharacterized membrane protein YeaQ/YmgE (transglycosylase-associated protein family)